MGKTAYVTASNGKPVRLRAGMSDDAATIVKLDVGTVVDVVEQGNRDGVEWATIIDPDGRRGYMMAKFLNVLEYADENAQQDAETEPGEVTITLPRSVAEVLYNSFLKAGWM